MLLYEGGHRKEFPCAECPGGLSPEHIETWEVFCAAATRTVDEANGSRKEHVSVDWQLVWLLLEVRAVADAGEVVEMLVSLVKAINGSD